MTSRSALLRLIPQGNRYKIDIIHDNSVNSYRVEVARDQLVLDNEGFRAELAPIVRPIGSKLTLTQGEMQDVLTKLARIGARAFRRVFPDPSPARSRITHLLDEKPIETIRIWSEDFTLPWELMCPESPHRTEDGSLIRQKMWGERFVIQRAFALNRELDSRGQMKLSVSRPKVALAMLRELKCVKDEQACLERLHTNRHVALRILERLDPKIRNDEMGKVVSFFDEESDIAHFACHVEPNRNASLSALVISNHFKISPNDIEDFRIRFNGEPLVVLNACDTGVRNSFQTADFVSTLLTIADVRGIIATECEVPTRFAAAFAQKLYDTFLLGGRSIGRALLETRLEFMGPEHHNPLGLLYSLYQVDPDFQFVKAAVIKTERSGS